MSVGDFKKEKSSHSLCFQEVVIKDSREMLSQYYQLKIMSWVTYADIIS